MRGPTVQERYWGGDRGPYSDDGWAHRWPESLELVEEILVSGPGKPNRRLLAERAAASAPAAGAAGG